MCLSLIIPVHDRESTITEEVWALAQAASQVRKDWELVLVDRGSRDRTPEILERLRHHEPRLNLVYQCRKKGLGEALRSGVLHARGDVMVIMDRPGEWNLSRLGEMVEELETCDLVAGFRRKGPHSGDFWLTGWLFRLLLKLPPASRENGVMVLRRELLQKISFGEAGREALWELPAQAVRQGFSLKMIPVPFFPRDAAKDPPLAPSWKTCLHLARIVWRSRPQPLFTPTHEASTSLLRLEFLSGQDRVAEGRLSLEN